MINKDILAQKRAEGKLSSLKAKQSPSHSEGYGKGVISVISSKDNGKRILISSEAEEILDLHDTISFLKGDGIVIMGSELMGANQYRIRRSGKRAVVYCAGLVAELSELLHLDFSDGRVSNTVSKYELSELDDKKVIVIESEDKDYEGIEE